MPTLGLPSATEFSMIEKCAEVSVSSPFLVRVTTIIQVQWFLKRRYSSLFSCTLWLVEAAGQGRSRASFHLSHQYSIGDLMKAPRHTHWIHSNPYPLLKRLEVRGRTNATSFRHQLKLASISAFGQSLTYLSFCHESHPIDKLS